MCTFLVDEWRMLDERAGNGFCAQLTGRIECELPSAVERYPDSSRIGSGSYPKVILEPRCGTRRGFGAMVDEVDAGIEGGALDPGEASNIRPPLRWIVADEVVRPSRS